MGGSRSTETDVKPVERDRKGHHIMIQGYKKLRMIAMGLELGHSAL